MPVCIRQEFSAFEMRIEPGGLPQLPIGNVRKIFLLAIRDLDLNERAIGSLKEQLPQLVTDATFVREQCERDEQRLRITNVRQIEDPKEREEAKRANARRKRDAQQARSYERKARKVLEVFNQIYSEREF